MQSNLTLINKNELQFDIIDNYKIFICSYGFSNLDNRVFSAQKEVFDYFGITINQYKGNLRHPQFMDIIINNIDSDFFIFFDIDCIPLSKNLVTYIIDKIGFDSIIGIEQQCNSNTSINHIYCGPACFAISKEHYLRLGQPSFNETTRSDVAEELTHISEEMKQKIHFFKKYHSDNDLWKLGEDRYFGHGTNYEDKVYHQFEIRKQENIEKFLTKCLEIIKND